jgi:hypothetical protein
MDEVRSQCHRQTGRTRPAREGSGLGEPVTKRRPSVLVNAASMSRVDGPPANSSTASASERPTRFSRTADTNASAISRNCGAAYSTVLHYLQVAPSGSRCDSPRALPRPRS